MEIKKAKSPDIFKRIGGNRELNPGHVNRLKKAIENSNGLLLQYNPIVVNEHMEIIDGQHRLEAVKQSKDNLSIYYQVVPGLDLSDVQNINSNSKMWTPNDYAKAYAELGNNNYIKFLEHRKMYLKENGKTPEFNHEITMAYVGVGQNNTTTGFKDGKFIAGDPKETKKYTSMLLELKPYLEHYNLRATAVAFLNIAQQEKYNHTRMVEKMKKLGDQMARNTQLLDAVREFETIYNHKLSEDKKVRFF